MMNGRTRSIAPEKAEDLWGFFGRPLPMNQVFDGAKAASIGWSVQAPLLMEDLQGNN